MDLAVKVHTAFGLAFDVEKDIYSKSGFRPAYADLSAGKPLFGKLRLEGFAQLLRLGFAENLIIIGGNEGRYKDEKPAINRAAAIREMLVQDYAIDPQQVSSIPSLPNTNGNILAIVNSEDYLLCGTDGCAVASNHYHLPRVFLDLWAAKAVMPLYPAEAFLLMGESFTKRDLLEQLSGGVYNPLTERMVEEIQGIAQKVLGTYKAKK